jgi:hypothetical protein
VSNPATYYDQKRFYAASADICPSRKADVGQKQPLEYPLGHGTKTEALRVIRTIKESCTSWTKPLLTGSQR